MLNLKAPGVYTQEKASGVYAIGGAPTAVALFVGPTKTGIDGRAIRIKSFGDYERSFGGLDAGSSLSYSVLHFFVNGGGEAWVIRVPPDAAQSASSTFKRDNEAGNALTLKARSAGSAGAEIFVEFDPFGIGSSPYETTQDRKRFNLTILNRSTGAIERFTNLSTSPASTRFASEILNDESTGSQLVGLTVETNDGNAPQATGSIYQLRTLASSGTFDAAVNTTLTIRFRDAAGLFSDSAGSPKGIEWSKQVEVFEKDAAVPGNAVALAAQLKSRLNGAIRADASLPQSLRTLGIDVDVQEGSRFIRLRVAGVADGPDTERVSDATMTLTGGSLASKIVDKVVVENPSRYRLGTTYGKTTVGGTDTKSEVTANSAGQDGTKGIQPTTQAFKNAVSDVGKRDPFFNTMCLPDLVRSAPNDPTQPLHAEAKTIYELAAQICMERHAFLIVDPFPGITTAGAAESWKSAKFTMQSEHAGIFFPNIRVDDPLEPGSIRTHPPSGAIAGLFARNDSRTGVWQSPAGTDAGIAGTYGPAVVLSDEEHGLLNPIGINVIRKFPIYGTVNFGSRTVNGLDVASSDYKYVAVRRTANHIQRSLSEGLRWAVHKPNGEQLWSQIRLAVNSFMQGMFRQGAFKGTSAREAYLVACDSSTTTPTDIQMGVVNISVGFAPLRPAEFVVITLRQIVQAAA
nr:phage tail sheath C-terminal domain-containing protein [uncultured Sphingomonas sp.]